jgi:hypothetical protein
VLSQKSNTKAVVFSFDLTKSKLFIVSFKTSIAFVKSESYEIHTTVFNFTKSSLLNVLIGSEIMVIFGMITCLKSNVLMTVYLIVISSILQKYHSQV